MIVLSPVAGRLRRKVIDFFFPRYCVGCGKNGDFLCPVCRQTIPRILPPFCQRCGKPEASGGLCVSCWSVRSDLDGVRSPFRFDGVIRRAVHELKYHNVKALAGCLAELIADYLESNPVPGEVLIPVPLHPRRLRQRGYNQSGLLAAELGSLMSLPVIEGSLRRVKDSLPQAKAATVEERWRNVKDAFACPAGVLVGKQVILLDDVCTTGATLEAAAMALKAAGASLVWGVTLARET